MKFKFYLLILFCQTSFSLSAQDSLNVKKDSLPSVDLMTLSLEELLEVKITVASRKEMTLRESPGIITIITEEEIKSIGARDLIDVFRLVPGLDFGADIQNYVGLGVRGIWASEGKAAIFWDGIEVNDLLYGTVPFGGHYSVDNIKKIEIIRGPGSALYGGTSELAVINITSKKSEQNGAQISGMYGQMDRNFGRSQMSATFGKEFGKLKTHFGAYAAETRRSNESQQNYYDPSLSFPMKNNSELKNMVFNGGVDYKDFSFNFLIDRYSVLNKESHYDRLAAVNIYDTYAANLKYNFKISDKLKIVPTYQYRYNQPWAELDTTTDGYYYNRFVTRHLGKAEVIFDPTDKLNIVAGGQFFSDIGKSITYDPDPSKTITFSPNNSTSVQYNNYSLFGQLIYQTIIGNFTAGARYDRHSLGFDAFVPRFGYTFVKNKFHFKLLAAQAFRTPYIANITNNDIKPEKTTTYEAEVGFQITKGLSLTLNGFYTYIDNILIYYYVGTDNGYRNGNRAGTQGIETEIKYKAKKLYLMANYSYYQAIAGANVPEFQVNKSWFQDPASAQPMNANLGFAPHKFNLLANLSLTKWLDWNVSSNIYSTRYSYQNYNSDSAASYIKEFPAMALVNTFINFKILPIPGMELGIGCYDIFNEKQQYLAPYTTFDGTVTAGGVPGSATRAPLPGSSREFIIKIVYKL